MAITKITTDTDINAGQWLCKESFMYHTICASPRMVVKTSGQRIYLTNRHGEDEGDYIARKSALYLCDTKEEALAVHAISNEQVAAITASTKAIEAAHKAKIDALIAAAVPA
jgi:hypothetical protein